MIWIILIFGILILLNRTKEYKGVVLFFANVGTGKTTFLSKLAQHELRKMAKGKSKFKYIVSNATISGVTHVPDIRALMKKGALQDTFLLIDEGSIVYNNRQMNLTEMEIQWFKLIRHYGCVTVVVSQSHNDVDVTLRRLYTSIYLLNYMPIWTLIRPIKKTVGIDDMTHDIVDMYKFRNPFSWRVFTRPLYFKYFNSWWIPSNVPIHDLSQLEILPQPEIRSFKDRMFKLIKAQVPDSEIIQQLEMDNFSEITECVTCEFYNFDDNICNNKNACLHDLPLSIITK